MRFEMNNIYKNNKKYLLKDIATSFVCGFIFVLLLSHASSILNTVNFGSDSAWIQLVAKAWTKGLIPYVDTFDHKGPLYFAIDAIGYLFSNSRLGLYIVQSVMMSVQIFIMFACIKFVCDNSKQSTIISSICLILFLMFYSYTMCDGGLSEEYSNFFLLISFYYLIKYYYLYYKEGIVCHPWTQAFIYGLCFGAITMIRINNAISMCIYIFFIITILVKNKEWKNLWQNALAALIGALVVIIPFCIYFYINDALYEFWHYAFEYNYNYMKIKIGSSDQPLKRLIFYLAPEMMLIVSDIYLCIKKKYILAITSLVCALVQGYMLLSGAQFTHYFMLGIPLIILSYVNYIIAREEYIPKTVIKKVLIIVFLIPQLICVVFGIRNLPRQLEETFGTETISQKKEYNDSLLDMVSMIPEEERDEVGSYNIKGCQKVLYLISDVKPAPRHMLATELHTTYDYSVMQMTMDWFYDNNPKWIIMPDSSDMPEMQEFLEGRYELVYEAPLPEDDTMLLYKKK